MRQGHPGTGAPVRGPAIDLDATWPGLGADGSVVIPIDPSAWPPPRQGVEHAGLCFDPKSELHVTVVGRALGATLRAAIAAGRFDEGALRAAFATGRWRVRRSGRWLHLHRDASADMAAADTLVEPVAVPAMARFHARLATLLGGPLPVPPPHVTLFIAGATEGIGVPDAATLASLRRGAAFAARD
jgi:hypothetical protein